MSESMAAACRRAAVAGLLIAGALAPSLGTRFALAQDAPVRVPAATLVPVESREKAPDPEGFLQRWVVLEPIAADGRLGDSAAQATVNAEHFEGQLTAVPSDGDTVMVGEESLTWHAVDSLHYNVNLFHFARSHGRPTSNVLFWAVTVIDVPEEMHDVRLAIGSNSASFWWVNGEQVIDIYNDRQTVIDDGVSDRLTLRRGRNVIRAAVVNGGGATDFCARFLDADNQPITGFRITL